MTTEHYTPMGRTGYVLAPANGIIMKELMNLPAKYGLDQSTIDSATRHKDDVVIAKNLADFVLQSIIRGEMADAFVVAKNLADFLLRQVI
jgi:hypothetical protein